MDEEIASGEFVAVWPGAAYRAGADGRVMLSCKINVHGLAEWCGVKSESPAHQGFGAAALQMRPTFKLKPATGADGPIEAMMNIAVKFKAPDSQFHPRFSDLQLHGQPNADEFGRPCRADRSGLKPPPSKTSPTPIPRKPAPKRAMWSPTARC